MNCSKQSIFMGIALLVTQIGANAAGLEKATKFRDSRPVNPRIIERQFTVSLVDCGAKWSPDPNSESVAGCKVVVTNRPNELTLSDISFSGMAGTLLATPTPIGTGTSFHSETKVAEGTPCAAIVNVSGLATRDGYAVFAGSYFQNWEANQNPACAKIRPNVKDFDSIRPYIEQAVASNKATVLSVKVLQY